MKRQITAIALALFMTFVFLAGCSNNTPAPTPIPTPKGSTETPYYPLTVTDQAGREVTISKPMTKIIAITASCAEIVYALGASDAVIRRGTYCDY